MLGKCQKWGLEVTMPINHHNSHASSRDARDENANYEIINKFQGLGRLKCEMDTNTSVRML